MIQKVRFNILFILKQFNYKLFQDFSLYNFFKNSFTVLIHYRLKNIIHFYESKNPNNKNRKTILAFKK